MPNLRPPHLRVVSDPMSLDLPRRSSPLRRLLVGLGASALTWAYVYALIRGYLMVSAGCLLVARVCEWSITEDGRW